MKNRGISVHSMVQITLVSQVSIMVGKVAEMIHERNAYLILQVTQLHLVFFFNICRNGGDNAIVQVFLEGV